MGKEETVGHQHFLLFPQCFQNPSPKRSFNVRVCCKHSAYRLLSRVKTYHHMILKDILILHKPR